MTDKETEKALEEYRQQGLTCKEDLIFEILLHLLQNTNTGYEDMDKIEESYRKAYDILPHYNGLVDDSEFNREVIIRALTTLENINMGV